MWNEGLGAFTDYNYERGEISDFVSMASFYPLFVGLATKEEAERTLRLLPLLKQEHGYSSTAKCDGLMYLQWDYPQGWGPHHYILIKGLDRYGYKNEALEAARLYSDTVERTFEKTGNIWEKYNVVTGEVADAVKHDDKACTMMGWSAGIYLFTNKRMKG
jgi:alpha,alpha-trehalase